MIDLHTHTILSDGQLIPAEHIRRAEFAGYRVLGFADHADLSNIEVILPQLLIAAKRENELGRIEVLAGVELTHVRPQHFVEATELARKCGAQFVIAHGETVAEPVLEGTNRAAIEAGVDILAHPGLISLEDAALSAERNVMLEITAKAGHSLTNGHVVRVAKETGARLVFGSDAHGPAQMPSRDFAEKVLQGAGLEKAEIEVVFKNMEDFAKHKMLQADADTNADW